MNNLDKALLDLVLIGSCVYLLTERKWYNPMRYIKGPTYCTTLEPSGILIPEGGESCPDQDNEKE